MLNIQLYCFISKLEVTMAIVVPFTEYCFNRLDVFLLFCLLLRSRHLTIDNIIYPFLIYAILSYTILSHPR